MGAPLPRRRLGRTALELSAMGFGAASIGGLLRPVGERDAAEAVAAALEGGITYFDVAPQYGNGLSEHRLGAGLRGVPRADYVLSTKVGRMLRPVTDAEHQAPGFGGHYKGVLPFRLEDLYTYDAVMRSFEDSLQRLGLARIDMLYVHNIDPGNHSPAEIDRLFGEAMEGGYKALERLRADGIVRAIGVGNYSWKMCERFAHAGDFDAFMVAWGYTLLQQGALPFLDYCTGRGLGVVVAAPFCSGILATGPTDDAAFAYRAADAEVKARVRALDEIGRAHGVALPAAALQFPLAHPAVASVVPGCADGAQVRANLAHMTAPVPPAYWSDIESLLAEGVPVP